MNGQRVVYDTMVFLQAALRPERQYATIEAVEDKRLTLFISAESMFEVHGVMNRSALATKFPALTPERVAQFIGKIMILATVVDPVPGVFTWPQHRDDDHLFNLAIAAKADRMVTWETRILKLAKDTTAPAHLLRQLAPGLAIVTPSELATELRGSHPQNSQRTEHR